MNHFKNKKTLKKHVVELTRALIRFPSHCHEKGKLFELIDYISDYFEDDPICIRPFVSGGLPSLLITFEETKHPQILFSGHLDVVENSVRYEAEEVDGKLYGSGALDMKGGVACMMAVMKHFCGHAVKPSLGLLLTSDEETGSDHGTPLLLGQEELMADFVIVNEGRWQYDIVTQEKGVIALKLSCQKPGAHSAYPWKSKNPILEINEALANMGQLFPEPSSTWDSTFAVTSIHAGKEFNTIPGEAEAMVNIRFTGGAEWSKQALLKKLKRVLPSGVKMETVMWGEVFQQDQTNNYVQMIKAVAAQVTGKVIHFGQNHGASDARFFHQKGIPCVSLGPTGNHHHTDNEYVDIDSLVVHARVLKNFVERVMEMS